MAVIELGADGKVRCHICLEFNKREYKGKWVLKASFSGHAGHPIHLKALQNQEELLIGTAPEVSENYATLQDVIMDSPPKGQNKDASHLGMNDTQEQEMWKNFDGQFELEESEVDLYEQKRKDFDQRVDEYGLWGGLEGLPGGDPENIEELWQENEQDDLLSELLEHTSRRYFNSVAAITDQRSGLKGEEETTALRNKTESADTTWFPYPSKLAFLLDTIDNLPRLRISTSFMKVLLWLLREVGVQGVPSHDGFRKVQKSLKRENIIPTVHWKSPRGHTYSFNDPRATVANVSQMI